MKYAEFNIDSNNIEFFNSHFGIESVLLNKKRISKKFSFTGIKHKIALQSKDLTLESKYKLFDNHEINLQLKENGKLIETKTVKVALKQRFGWIVLGIFAGIVAYKLLNSIVENLS